jgi:urea carboxylase
VTTSFLSRFPYRRAAIEVLSSGTQTTVQDLPGRLGYWNVGVPPSGPMDSLALQLANRLVGNDSHAAGLENGVSGPELRFGCEAVVALTGAPMDAWPDGIRFLFWQAVRVSAGGTLKIGAAKGPGLRAYLAVGGGLTGGEYLGSLSTFMLSGFGGHDGRARRLEMNDIVGRSARGRNASTLFCRFP